VGNLRFGRVLITLDISAQVRDSHFF
jgi:hypothetical protein